MAQKLTKTLILIFFFPLICHLLVCFLEEDVIVILICLRGSKGVYNYKTILSYLISCTWNGVQMSLFVKRFSDESS